MRVVHSRDMKRVVDTWKFTFNARSVAYKVYMIRKGGPQLNAPPSNTTPTNIVHFTASVDMEALKQEGLTPADFPVMAFTDSDINNLRHNCEMHVKAALAQDWEKVIIVGTNQSYGYSTLDGEEESVSKTLSMFICFDFVTAYRSGGTYKLPGRDAVLEYKPSALLHSAVKAGMRETCANLQVFPYSEELARRLLCMQAVYRRLTDKLTHKLMNSQFSDLDTSLSEVTKVEGLDVQGDYLLPVGGVMRKSGV